MRITTISGLGKGEEYLEEYIVKSLESAWLVCVVRRRWDGEDRFLGYHRWSGKDLCFNGIDMAMKSVVWDLW